MTFTELALSGIRLIEPRVFGDERGTFFESFSQRAFDAAFGSHVGFVQDNHSTSAKGVLRGLHYQLEPSAQGKLVRAIAGELFDVVVDIRRSSETFGKWLGVTLTAENRKQLWIPPGFAHGFLALTDNAQLAYKTTDYYAPAAERCIAWDDPAIGIAWPIGAPPILSAKDKLGVTLEKAETFS